MAATKKPPTAQQWGEHREEIEKLYIKKNWPLRLVMEELAKKGFEPTSSQYRSRFKIWKLKKPRKSTKICSTDGGEVTTHSLTTSEPHSIRDEHWQFGIDDSSFYNILEEIERDPEFAFFTAPRL
ncbi:hypothetical protein MMC31_008113 [Peltigera leucophlebia]|nr:hypothetical protein [Peltigera leucophlebia]